jgi:hypothetical protein
MTISDDAAMALADGLSRNTSLKHLRFSVRAITSLGWSAFSRLLCDTSTINNTYLSNHTLERIGDYYNRGTSLDAAQYLTLNEKYQQHVAICKILLHHPDFSLQPLFQWDLKCLPLVAHWFDHALLINKSTWVKEMIMCFPTKELLRRKLSAVYQLVRGTPLLEVSDHCIKAIQNSSAKRNAKRNKRYSIINRLFIRSK